MFLHRRCPDLLFLEGAGHVITVIVSLAIFDYDTSITDVKLLFYHQIGYLAILSISLFIEIGICIISMRGSILDSDVRAPINIWIYIKTVVMLFDIAWLIMGTLWLTKYYLESTIVSTEKRIFFAIIVSNWALVFVTMATIWCTFDTAGRSWVKMKKYQRSMRETESRFNYKRSNSMNRNWRQRKVIRAYQDSWDHRCRLLFCCIGSSERNRNSFTDIARLLSDFFRELDVVPSDVVAGLVLLRKFQRLEREAVVRQRKNGTYEFLSGVPITERTQFLALNDAKNYDFFQTVIHYMYFAQGAYGWPMYFIINRSKMYNLIPELKCFGCCLNPTNEAEIIQDNCCYCNYAALKKTLQVGDIEIVYVTYHVDVGETPFFVAIDYTQKKIVVSIRGTLSMKDILTDLNAEAEVLPLNPPRDDWLGHKGMVQAAIYIRNKLEEENIIRNAFNKNLERNTNTFGLVLVGHSLGAGTAAILAILMKADYPTLQCFAYSPPGGLLSMPAVEYSKKFITSVVLGKDVVPRIGLYQMEALRADLINAIQRSIDPKWKTISCSMICCCCGPEPKSVVEMSVKDTHINKYQEERDSARSASTHPTDSTIALTIHQPLYPPGRIIHIVRHHPRADEKKYDRGWRNVLKSREPVYQAIWADSIDFDEVLISPVMLQDHMPDKVLAALKKVVTTSGPRKPHRQASNAFSTTSNDLYRSNQDVYSYYNCSNMELHQTHHHQHQHNSNHMGSESNGPYDSLDSRPSLSQADVQTPTTSSITQLHQQQPRVCLETSFTNLHSPQMTQKHAHFPDSISSSKASSLAGSILSRSQISCIQYDISSAMENSITTVTRKSPIKMSTEMVKVEQVELVLQLPKTKCVAFEDTPSPLRNLKRQHSAKIDKKPKSLPIPPLRRASDVTNGAETDEWLGLAPLASPETLSEISSISSRNSVRNGLTSSIEHYLHNVTNNNVVDINDVFESQLHTPTVLRRAPKFIENLSSCAEDSRNIDQYKRMGRVIVPPPLFPPSIQDSSEEEDSFASANSYKKVSKTTTSTITNTNGGDHTLAKVSNSSSIKCHRRQNSKSADQLDDVVASTNKQQNEGSVVRKLTFSDSNIIHDNDNVTARADNNSCAKCCNKHCSCSNQLNNLNTGSQDTTFYSANSSIDCMSAKTNSNPHIMPEGVLESHFPLHQDAFTNTTELYAKHYSPLSNDQEHSTALQQMSKVAFSSPLSTMSRGKRKNCIYPSAMSSQPLYATAKVENVKLYTTTTNTTTNTNKNNNNNTTTNIPELTIANGSSSPSPRSRTPNESSV
ncbi:hypothetical protein FF38_08956 [Lucilia cuprina]|uniref:Diacylglycerol lipase-alpha n=1 Tax=Lucilia cuprina TaxID=7375 RepID=A0A0L0C4Y1_LUCCU|nr:hypothetical protein FF38_08956 [Lucilia cuprina]